MLNQLVIKNFVLIKHLEINPSKQFNIVTGETGAGKSILLGALALLLGNRADTKVLYDDQEKCFVEGTFGVASYHLQSLFEENGLDYDDEVVVRREIAPNGKSRAFINDTPVNLTTLKDLGERLMDIHSQHDTLKLGEGAFQLSVIDVFASNQPQKDAYSFTYKAFRQAERALAELTKENDEIRASFDYNSFLLKELDDANLDDIRLEEEEQELSSLENAESIKASLNAALGSLNADEYSVESALRATISAIGQAAGYSEKFLGMKERLENSLVDIRDIAYDVEKEESNLFYDPERIGMIKERLDKVYSLQKKHKLQTVEELISLRENLREKVEKVQNFDEALDEAKLKLKEALKMAKSHAEILSKTRAAVVDALATEVNKLLSDLGMPNARLSVKLQPSELSPSGGDWVEFLFSANKGISQQPLGEVASGGEFSRLMLAIKYIIARKVLLPTIIFDEIDTGISGEVAIKVGNMMKEMAKHHQVIAISHLPQIAAKGDTHYYVYKDHSDHKTVSKVKMLSTQERMHEIAQMIGGSNPSATAYDSAKELMGN